MYEMSQNCARLKKKTFEKKIEKKNFKKKLGFYKNTNTVFPEKRNT